MGFESTIFKCPKCGQQMGSSVGPNWTFVDAPGALHGNIVILSCTNQQCKAVLGSYYEVVAIPEQTRRR